MDVQTVKHFVEVMPDGRWKVRFDHHMIDSFKKCQLFFNYRHVEHLRYKGGHSWYAEFGIWWASVLEDIYRDMAWRQANNMPGPAKSDFIIKAVKKWQAMDMVRFELMAPKLYTSFAVGIMGILVDKREIKMPMGVVNMIVGYYDFVIGRSDYTKWKVITAEQTFGIHSEVIIAENDRVVVAYTGRPDLIVYDTVNKEVYAVDHKTTGSIDNNYRLSWKPNAQLAGYTTVVQKILDDLKIESKVTKAIINAAGRNTLPDTERGRSMVRFDRIKIEYSDLELLEWKTSILKAATDLRYAIENDSWQRNETVCHNQYNSPCEYREIDSKGSLDDRQRIKQGLYQIVTPWSAAGEGTVKETK